MKDFAGAVIKGMITVAILTISSIAGVIKGIWEESDRLSRMYEIQWTEEWRRGHRHTPPNTTWMYWIIRIFAFLLQMIILTILFNYLRVFIERSLRL